MEVTPIQPLVLFKDVAETPIHPSKSTDMLARYATNEHAPTLRELSSKFGISSERCRQVCVQGLTRLRRQMAGRRHQIEPDLEVCAA